jgi:hypothetical protein
MRMGIGLGIGINRSNYAQGIFNAYQSRVIADGGVTEAGACVDAVGGLLLTASLLLIPSGYKSGKAYAQIPTNGNGDLSWTRASTANRTNSSGNIELMGSGVPSLSYMYGSCPALLLEPQRTNLVFPSGTATTQTRTVTAVAHTLSFYGTGTVVLSGVAIATLTGTGANNRVTLTFTPTAGSLILTVTGTVTNWQLEVGSYASTVVTTTTAAATRVADSFSRDNIYTNGLITSSGGTWFVELRGNVALLRDGTANAIGIGDSNTLLTNSFIIRNSSSTASRFGIVKRVGGTLSVLFTTTTDTVKIAIKWNGSTADVFINGTKQVSATAFTATNMEFLQGDGSQQPAFIQSMALYPTPLSDTDCTTLTTL